MLSLMRQITGYNAIYTIGVVYSLYDEYSIRGNNNAGNEKKNH